MKRGRRKHEKRQSRWDRSAHRRAIDILYARGAGEYYSGDPPMTEAEIDELWRSTQQLFAAMGGAKLQAMVPNEHATVNATARLKPIEHWATWADQVAKHGAK